MKIKTIVVLFFSLLFSASLVLSQEKARAKTKDNIKILEVSATAPVKDGVSNQFTVQIEYTLESEDEGMVSVGFNSDDPGSYKMSGQKKVIRGTTVLTMKANVVPKEWKEQGDFFIYVNLSPISPNPSGYRPFAGARKLIEFEP